LNAVRLIARLAALPLAAFFTTAAYAADVPVFTRPQAQFVEFCGGCHGFNGVSVPKSVPTLKGRIGYFLCTDNSRAYLGRLPNVALSSINNHDLAEVLNFVVFGMGEGSAPKGAKPFTEEEIKQLRQEPLNKVALSVYRERIVDDLIANCGAPESLKEYTLNAKPANTVATPAP